MRVETTTNDSCSFNVSSSLNHLFITRTSHGRSSQGCSMDENVRNLENTILVTLPAGVILSEADLALRVEQLRAVFPVNDEDRDQLLKRLHARLAIRMDTGVALVEPDHKPWLLARKP